MTQLPISLRVQGVTFATPDPEKLAGFYQRAFNLPAAIWHGGEKKHLILKLDNMYLGFDKVKEKAKKKSDDAVGPVVWFYVDDVDAAFIALTAAGARVYSGVNREERPGEALAVLYDPEDNMVGIIGSGVPPERRIHK